MARIPTQAQSVKTVARAAALMREQMLQSIARLDALIAGLAPQELAKAATRPALQYALQVIADDAADAEQRLKAASIILSLGHAQAPKVIEATIDDAATIVTPAMIREAAIAIAADIVDVDSTQAKD